jgi:hypothetical protein
LSISFPLFLILAFKDQDNFFIFPQIMLFLSISCHFQRKPAQLQLPVVFSKFILAWKTEIYSAVFHAGNFQKNVSVFLCDLVLDYEEEVVEKVGCTLIINSHASLI